MQFAAGAARLHPEGANRNASFAAVLDRRGGPHAAPQRADQPSQLGHQRSPFFKNCGRHHAIASSAVTAAHGRTFAAVAASSEPELRKGTLVEVKKQHRSLLVVLSRLEGKQKCYGLDKDGNQHSFFVRDVGFVDAETEYEWRDIAQLEEECEKLAEEPVSEKLEVVWSLQTDKANAMSTAEVCELMFGKITPAGLWATHKALHSDSLYFSKQPRSMWLARPASQVTELTKKHAKEQAVEAIAAGFRSKVAEALAIPHGKKPRDVWLSHPAWAAWIRALEAVALEDPMKPDLHPVGAEVLRSLGISAARPASAAVSLLIDIGHWSYHENVMLRKSGLATAFSPELEAAAAEVAERPQADPDADTRRDLTDLKTLTIDSEDTTEIDDALSAEELPGGGHRVWVHIADPSRYIPLGHPLEEEASRRGTSVYFPTGHVSMFPTALAEGPLSLRQGVESCALTVMVDLAGDGSIRSSEVFPSRVRVTYRLSYNSADELISLDLDEEKELRLLAAVARQRRVHRRRNGAVYFLMPETSVRVEGADVMEGGPEATVDVRAEDERLDSVSRMMVQEMMILAGEVAGGLGASRKIPLPYRGQPSPVLPSEEELDSLPEGPCRSAAIRNCMSASTQGIVPTPHASLGLDAYVQMSSPIRRYGDLVAHYQLKAFLRGDPLPLSDMQVLRRSETASAMSREAQRVSRLVERYWLAHWFASQPAGAAFSALVLRPVRGESGLVSVLIGALGLEVATRLSRDYSPGDVVTLEVQAARPRDGVIFFREKW